MAGKMIRAILLLAFLCGLFAVGEIPSIKGMEWVKEALIKESFYFYDDGQEEYEVLTGWLGVPSFLERKETETIEYENVLHENQADIPQDSEERVTGDVFSVETAAFPVPVKRMNPIVEELKETKSVEYLWNHFYIVDSTTSVTKSLFPVKQLLERKMQMEKKKNTKQILIYHTHGASETFADSRTGKIEDSVVGVGNVLAEELEKRGYGVYHDTKRYDLINGKIDRSLAYNEALEGIEKILSKNKDIEVVIDLHRDAVGKGKHTFTTINGKKTAIVMFFNGLSRSKNGPIEYLYNPNLQGNLAFSLQMKCAAMEYYDGFTKPIYLKGYRYNLHVKEKSLLIELGNENNTVEEAKNAAAPLADILEKVLSIT